MKIIAIDGAIGVGKSSTAKFLRDMLGEDDTIISDEKIPLVLLEQFYSGVTLSPLTLQNTILASRFISHLNALVKGKKENKKYVILDRSLIGDEVFARINILNGSKMDFEKYMELNREYSKFFIYDYKFLISTTDESMLNRIHNRHRQVELGAANDYFIKIKKEHELVFSKDDKAIVIDNADLNIEQTAHKLFEIIKGKN